MKKRLKNLYISEKKIQKAISKPIPKKIIDCFYETPLTASQIADAVSFPKDKIYYHIKKLVALDILYVSETKEIKGIIQKKFLPQSQKIVFGDSKFSKCHVISEKSVCSKILPGYPQKYFLNKKTPDSCVSSRDLMILKI